MSKIKNFKIKTPEEALKGLCEWFDINKRLTLITAIVVGLIAHVLLLSILITSPDGLWNSIVYSANTTEVTSGRWLINVIDSMRKNLAIPSITTVISIIMMAFTAVIITDLLEFKSKISCIVTAVFLVVSPCLTITLLYVYTADAYCYAFFFATMAVWCMYRKKHRVIGAFFGSIFTMLSIAVYQTYIGAIVALCILKAMIEVFNGEEYKNIFKNIGIAIISTIIGLGLYWGGEQIALNIYGVKLSNYHGASDIGLMNTIKNLPVALEKMYGYFMDFFIGNSIVHNTNMSRNSFYKVLFAAEGLALIYVLFARKSKTKNKKIIDALLILAMIAVLPMGINFVLLIAPETHCDPIVATPTILMIPFFMIILENFEINKGVILKWISISMCFVIAVTYYLAANSTYTGIRMKYNQAYTMTVRIVDRIENCEGYEPNKKWLFGGILDSGNTPVVSEIYFLTLGGFVDGPIFHGNYQGMIATWRKFLQTYAGIQPDFCSSEEYFEICGTQYFKDMPVFPAQGSVAEINGVMVVKLTQNVPTN